MRWDIKDLNIRYKGHPKYNSTKIDESDELETLIQKIEMVLKTNQGEIMTEPELGANLEYYLWQTKVPAETIKSNLIDQFNRFIPELVNYNYKIDTRIYRGTKRDILYIDIVVGKIKINYNLS